MKSAISEEDHQCPLWNQLWLRKLRSCLDQSVPYKKGRWGYLAFLYAYVCYRIFCYDYLGLMYFMGLYIIYLIVQYFTPSGLPDPDEDTFENSIFIQEGKAILESTEGDRPVLRSITQFNLWKSLLIIALVCIGCTYLDLFLIPVYWPFLLVYFFWLIALAVTKHCRHMKKYGYSFSDFNSKRIMTI